jgi:hypothetical protein
VPDVAHIPAPAQCEVDDLNKRQEYAAIALASSIARLIHEPAALGRAGFDVSVAA